MNDKTKEFLRQRVDPEQVRKLREELMALPVPEEFTLDPVSPRDCPRGPHRGPEGPNEDMSQCPRCWSPSYAMRPEGEEFGGHLADCALPRRHESYCTPGGEGHPPAAKVRGFWPGTPRATTGQPPDGTPVR